MRDHIFEWKAPKSRNTSETWSDEVVLECTLSVYQQCVDTGFAITDRPDQSDRRNPAVDGIFSSPSGRLVAVEITAVETYASQMETRSRVNKHLKPFEAELASYLPPGISCELPIHPLPRGHDWKSIGLHLAAHILSVADSLEPGASCHSVVGVPFEIWLAYEPWTPLRFYFRCSDPSRSEIEADLLASMVKALCHKQPQLRALANHGYRTVLVLTSHDGNFYRITWDSAYKAFLKAEAVVGSDHAQDVLFSFTGDCSFLYSLAFKGDPLFRNALNSHNMKFGRWNGVRPPFCCSGCGTECI